MQLIESVFRRFEPHRAWCTRVMLVLVATLPLALLVTARTLTPSKTGLGTHQQLGLPPCSMRVAFGVRCPGCGMTTSWAHFTRGQWTASLGSNIAGFCLACLALIVSPILIRAAWKSRPPTHRAQLTMALSFAAVIAFSFVEWAVRVYGSD